MDQENPVQDDNQAPEGDAPQADTGVPAGDGGDNGSDTGAAPAPGGWDKPAEDEGTEGDEPAADAPAGGDQPDDGAV